MIAAILVCSFASGQTNPEMHSSALTLDVIVGRMQHVKIASQPEFLSVVREYLFSKGTSGEVTSKVLAQLDYDWRGPVRYSIRNTTGSSRREDIVKRILEREVMTSAGPANWQ